MTPILDQSGNTIAYLHLNIILSTEKDTVLGLVLGNCVYGTDTRPIGKFFKDRFRQLDGTIMATLGTEAVSGRPLHESMILRQAWTILMQVKDHVCVWVEERNNWSSETLLDALLQPA